MLAQYRALSIAVNQVLVARGFAHAAYGTFNGAKRLQIPHNYDDLFSLPLLDN